MSWLHSISRQFDWCAANSRVRRNRPCSPSFFQRSGKVARKAATVNYKCAVPKPSPALVWPQPSSSPHGGILPFPITFLESKFPHPLAIRVPLQIETTLSDLIAVYWNRWVWNSSAEQKVQDFILANHQYLLYNVWFNCKNALIWCKKIFMV